VQPSPALARGFVTFGSFNHPEKVTPQVVQVWAAILSEVPKSRLLLKGWHFGDAAIRQHYSMNSPPPGSRRTGSICAR
jgi:predicted O-linked N-acetylglucosamine transferase (SPINDLY family)